MKWHGLDSASAPTDDRPKVMARFTNGLLQVRGEVDRRRGFARSTMAQLSAAWANFSGFAEYQGQVFAMTAYADKLEGFLNPGALWSDSQQTLLSGFFSKSGSAYNLVILRNGNQFSTGAIIVARPGRCPGSFQDGTQIGSLILTPGKQSYTFSWTPPTAGDWRFSVIPTLNGQMGPADCLTVIPNYFVFAGFSGGVPHLFYSPDGVTFSVASPASGNPSDTISAACFNLAGLAWVYSMDTGPSASSPDGLNWTAGGSMPTHAQNLLPLADGTVVALLDQTNPSAYITNNNGATWTLSGTIAAAGQFQGSATDGTNLGCVLNDRAVLKSTDKGANWIPLTVFAPAGSAPFGMTYGNGLWMVYGFDGSGAAVWTSPDFIFWTRQSAPATWNYVQGAVFGNGRWLLSGILTIGGGGVVVFTSDFITYSNGATVTGAQNALAYSLGVFAIASSSNSQHTIMTTTGNGTFTTQTFTQTLATKIGSATGTGAWAGLGL